MNKTYQQVATSLLNNRQCGLNKQRLSAASRPQNCEQALLIQAEMMLQHNDAVVGWKCSLPLSDEQLVVAPIFNNTLQSGENCSLFADNNKARIEPEIAFVLAVDLPANAAGYSEKQIDNAVLSCHMALELIEDRFHHESNVSFYEKLADCLANQGLYIGPEIDKVSAYLASEFTININQADNQQRFNGRHPNVLPQHPLHWLINYMSKRGVDFKAGQAIITGSYAGVIEVEFNCQTEIEYQGLGKYHVTFMAK